MSEENQNKIENGAANDEKEKPAVEENTAAENGTENGAPESNKYLFMYIALGCFLLGCVLFALSFFIHGAGVYLLISSMISELACLSFINAQKRKVMTAACRVTQILAYVIMFAAVIVFVLGTITSGAQNA